ncbi:MAG: WD40/YVTN/BNR-like repeat-containing protein [Bacteroidota bacterium]
MNPVESRAQIFGRKEKTAKTTQIEASSLQALQWRNIGPYRAGRSVAVAGHKDQPDTYYYGGTGGGVLKTTDGGKTWIHISDDDFNSGSVGALAVAPSDPKVIYAGMGETDIRGNMSPGDGVYKSTDGGKTWQHLGLEETRFISTIVVHPKNEDIVWVAAMGQLFGTEGNTQRGVYKSTDGGATWNMVLYHDKHTGAVDLEIDPQNPRVLYAALWEAYRNAWTMSSGGAGSGLYKSTDGGETWQELSEQPGMPKGVLGKIGIAASPAQNGRVWAIVENENGGVFRSDDGGNSWKRVNKNRALRQRAWYYSKIMADPTDAEKVYVLNVGFYRSHDGGQSFERISTPHGDHHDLWIAPNNPNRMIIGDDGGGQVSYNAGSSWSDMKQATAQFYHVTLDNQFPYRVYGAQQDNSTVAVKSRSIGDWSIDEKDWHSVAGGESGYIAVHPEKPWITFGGSYGGYLTRYNERTKQNFMVNVWPDNPMGAPASELRDRFQWTYPIRFSSHNSDILYTASQYVYRSNDGGMSWERISPDLTRDEEAKQGAAGGPITKDNTSVEYYNTIFTLEESPVQENLLWAGSDDGLVHLSRDGGENWAEVTPEDLPESLISIVEPSPHNPAKAYLAVNRYKFGDFEPYLYKTENYGKDWKKITSGIPEGDYTRVIREDPHVEGMLYAGTERGVWFSLDDGTSWSRLNLNLPTVPVRDLAIQKREKDLVAATHGRSFWILDDLAPLHQMKQDLDLLKQSATLFTPEQAYRLEGGSYEQPGMEAGENPSNGVVLFYHLADSVDDEITLTIKDKAQQTIRTFSSQETPEGHPVTPSGEFHEDPQEQPASVLRSSEGLQRFVWDMRYPPAENLDGIQILWGGSTRGPKAVPGTYQAILTVGDQAIDTVEFEVVKDPRIETTSKDFEAQFELYQQIHTKLDTTHKVINRIRQVRTSINDVLGSLEDGEDQSTTSVQELGEKIITQLDEQEQKLVQTKAESFQDVLNYPIKLNNKLAALGSTVESADSRPTQQMYDVYEMLSGKVDDVFSNLDQVWNEQIPQFNEQVDQLDIPAVKVLE